MNESIPCGCPRHDPESRQSDVPPESAIVGSVDGHPVWGLSRLTNRRVLCQLCFNFVWWCQLHELAPGVREDVCADCARREEGNRG